MHALFGRCKRALELRSSLPATSNILPGCGKKTLLKVEVIDTLRDKDQHESKGTETRIVIAFVIGHDHFRTQAYNQTHTKNT
jgi:hypothetical protein